MSATICRGPKLCILKLIKDLFTAMRIIQLWDSITGHEGHFLPLQSSIEDIIFYKMCGFVIEISVWDKEKLNKYFQQEVLVKMKILAQVLQFK